jgi:hypothetical protein
MTEEKQNWTAGPWRHNQVFRGSEVVRDEILSADGVVADDIRDPRDARLIAAAPELYAALADYIAGADNGFVSVDVDRTARAVLAKARGEALASTDRELEA